MLNHAGKSRVRLGFVTATDPLDRWSFSGTHSMMLTSLREEFEQVDSLGPFPLLRWQNAIGYRINGLCRNVFGKQYDFLHSSFASILQGRFFRSKAKKLGCQVLIAPAASTEIAFLGAGIPVIYSPDATFRQVRDLYPRFSDLLGGSAKEADWIESRAIWRARAVVVSSTWAMRSIVEDYGYDSHRVSLASYGANLDEIPTREEVFRRLNRGSGECRILFLGVDWLRKGGETAYRAWEELKRLGADVRLTVVGCDPPGLDPSVDIYPSLDKNDPAQERVLRSILLDSHFLLVPTRADCTPIAFSEAAAFGVPVYTCDVGGVASVVLDGVSGRVLPLAATPSEFAKWILCDWNDPQRYETMVRRARLEYEQRLNWSVWAAKIRDLAESIQEGRLG